MIIPPKEINNYTINVRVDGKDIPYLDYVMTWEGIKYDLNEVQGIMDIGRISTTT